MKSYTDLSQSKKLADILPLESADMSYSIIHNIGQEPYHCNIPTFTHATHDDIPCWSLATLLVILTKNKICHYDDRYYCQYMNEGDEFPIYSTAEYDNPVDVCMEMIEKLHKLKKL